MEHLVDYKTACYDGIDVPTEIGYRLVPMLKELAVPVNHRFRSTFGTNETFLPLNRGHYPNIDVCLNITLLILKHCICATSPSYKCFSTKVFTVSRCSSNKQELQSSRIYMDRPVRNNVTYVVADVMAVLSQCTLETPGATIRSSGFEWSVTPPRL